MQTTIVKWGNSQGVRIPKAFLQNMQITENDPVDMIFENEKIIIKKSDAKKHKTIRERLMEFYEKEFDQNHPAQKEIDWGEPVGKELW